MKNNNFSQNTGNHIGGSSALQKSVTERFLHALLFETIAVGLTAAALVWLMNKPMTEAGGLSIAISTIAMLWNMVFNAAFDRAQRRMGFQRTIGVRAMHAVLFEAGLTIAIVPLAAWALQISLMKALMLDIGVLVFFLFYAFVFNWCYDIVRAKIVAKMQNYSAASARCPQ